MLVTATAGDLGESFVPLRPGASIAARRTAELEAAAELLGVSRLVQLGHRDSGLPRWDEPAHPDALVLADPTRIARRVADLAIAESAEAIVHDDARGIYGHPDHVAVHHIGRQAAAFAGVTSYEATVDREHLHLADGSRHLVYAASRATEDVSGHATVEITLALDADPRELVAKRAAIAVHASQIRADAIDDASFAESYGFEWYVRAGERGILDELGNVHAFA